MTEHSKTIIISPSGNLYGSEQVLIEFLLQTKHEYCVYVPKKSQLERKLLKTTKLHSIKAFTYNYPLYGFLLSKLLLTKRQLYINEGGHIRYIKLLARLFPFKKFFIHIRLLEDCNYKRLKNLPNNIQIITVSHFLKEKIRAHNIKVIYDPYTLSSTYSQTENMKQWSNKEKKLKVGIVGRITPTKGLDNLFPILDIFEKERKTKIEILFFGSHDRNEVWLSEFNSKLKKYRWVSHQFMGFISEKNAIYEKIDLILHLNKVEALGRIIFESIDYDVPILTFEEGGCGELLKKLELSEFLIKTSESWAKDFHTKMIEFVINYPKDRILKAKEIIKTDYNALQYTALLEGLIG